MTPRPVSRCWGIGLGRTGTSSLCEAFRRLGYRNVLHNPYFEQLATADAGADNGVLIFYKYLDYKFPGSKFVLTLRDRDSWLRSMEYANAIYKVTSLDDDVPIMRRMLLYETVRFDRGKYCAAYDRHLAEVRRYFRDRRTDLLEMDIIAGDGWDKLCPFLGTPAPAAAFPHLHRRADPNVL